MTRPDPNGDPMVVIRLAVEAVDGRTPYVVRSAAKDEAMVLATPALGATIAYTAGALRTGVVVVTNGSLADDGIAAVAVLPVLFGAAP